jgi:hypothetical protein
MSGWEGELLGNPYANSLLQGVASWIGQSSGPVITAAVGALWWRSSAHRLRAEHQRDVAELDFLARPKPSGKLTGERLWEFHTELFDAFKRSSLPALKRDGTLRGFTLQLASEIPVSNPSAVQDYFGAVSAFLTECWSHTNKSQKICQARDEALDRISSAIDALGQEMSPKQREKNDILRKGYALAFLTSVFPVPGRSPRGSMPREEGRE